MVTNPGDTLWHNENPNYDFRIMIANNGSTDNTLEIAKGLSNITAIHLDEKGRGRALRKAWTESKADVMCYMDVDLSTDIGDLPRLIDAIAMENYDIAFGSRLIRGSKTRRSLKRELLSRGYNFLVKLLLGVKFSDAQCGFKAVNKKIVREIVPMVKDNGWFFDTELLVLAERKGYRIKEIPVGWEERKDSKVGIFETVFGYIGNLVRLRRRLALD